MQSQMFCLSCQTRHWMKRWTTRIPMFLPMGIVMSLNPGGVEALFKYLALVKYNLIDYQ